MLQGLFYYSTDDRVQSTDYREQRTENREQRTEYRANQLTSLIFGGVRHSTSKLVLCTHLHELN